MINKTNGSGKKVDDSTPKTVPLPPSPKNQVVYSYHRPTFESILEEYPELTQFFELKIVNPAETDNNISKNTNTSANKRSASNGKFSLNKIFKFQSNKSEQKGPFGFGKNKNKNSNSKSSNPPSSASTVRESLQRAALSLTNSLEINDIIEKQLKREYINIYAKIKNIPNLSLINNKPADQKTRKKKQNLNTNSLTYPYIIKILMYLKYQENLKICKAQHNHCEKHKKYIQNLLEIVNIVNKEYPNSDLIINGKLLNYSIMNDEKLLQAAGAPTTNSPSNYPIDKFKKTEIGSTVKYLREKTAKHEKRRKILTFRINQLINKELSSRSTAINELLNKLFNIDYNNLTIKINSSPSSNMTIKRDVKNYPVKRKSKMGRNRRISSSATKSYSSSNLAQLSKGKLELPNSTHDSDLSNSVDKKDRHPFADLNDNDNGNENKILDNTNNNNSPNNQTVSKSSSSSTLLQANNQNHSSDDEYSLHYENENKNDIDNNNKNNNNNDDNKNNNDDNDNAKFNQMNDNDNYISKTSNSAISIPTFEDESDPIFNSTASSLSSCNLNLPDYEEVIKELVLNESLDHIKPPLQVSHSDSPDDRNPIEILDQRINKEHVASSDDTILSDSESTQNKNKKLDADYEYSEYSDNELDLDEDDEDLTEFQDADESDLLFEETLGYIEDKEGLFLDFELLIEKASDFTEFKSELISNTIRKIKKSPKDSGILTIKLCQTFIDVFLQIEKKKEQQIQQQIKMEQNAILATQKNKVIPPIFIGQVGMVPYTISPYPNGNIPTGISSNNSTELSNVNNSEEKPKNVMRFLFIMFSKYIFNEIYTTTFHQEFFYVQDFLFSNSILNALDQIPSISSELIPALPYIPFESQNLKLSQLAKHESFRVYSSCIEDMAMLQFEPSLVDFCYAAFRILEKIQKIASEILYDKKIEEELEKMRNSAISSSYNPSCINNMGFPIDNFKNKCRSATLGPPMNSISSDNERGNSNSLPKATFTSFDLADGDEESSNKESSNLNSSNNKQISSSPSNSSVGLQKELPSIYSSKKSKMQLRADCQLSCDQLCDITTVIVIIAGPFDLRRMIELYSPYVSGLRLSSQLEFALMTMQSVCAHILHSFNPDSRRKPRKPNYEEQNKKEEEVKEEDNDQTQLENNNDQTQPENSNDQTQPENSNDQPQPENNNENEN